MASGRGYPVRFNRRDYPPDVAMRLLQVVRARGAGRVATPPPDKDGNYVFTFASTPMATEFIERMKRWKARRAGVLEPARPVAPPPSGEPKKPHIPGTIIPRPHIDQADVGALGAQILNDLGLGGLRRIRLPRRRR